MKKRFVTLLSVCLLLAGTVNAICTINPLDYTGRMVSGAFLSGTGRTSAAMFRGYTDPLGGKHAYMDIYGYEMSLYSSAWTANDFDVDKITDRVVSGDFDQDGYYDDVAAIYADGGTTASIREWTSFFGSITYYPSAWSASGYDATKVTGRVVSGDFDHDGYCDDIAAFYDYGSGNVKIHLWIGQGAGAFSYSWWWESTGYWCSLFTGRVVSGDFDHNGYQDNIAVLYDYGSGSMHIHMFTTNNALNSFNYTGGNGWWYTPSGYAASNISFRVVSGNFDHSGLINHLNDDLVAIYDYGGGVAKAHVWTSNGSSFSYGWKWEVTGFLPANITDRFVPFQTNQSGNPEKCFGMMALYNYGSTTAAAYHWQASTGSSWNFSSFTSELCPLRISSEQASASSISLDPVNTFHAFPNPSDGHFTIEINPTAEGVSSISVTDITGKVIYAATVEAAAGYRQDLDLSTYAKGVYFLRIVTPGKPAEIQKLLVQ